MENATLNQRIKSFYDQSTPIWLDTWGEHMHHGFYGLDGSEKKDHVQAQVDLLDTFVEWGHLAKATKVLDAGCGVGGSARYLANRFGADVLGVTLSSVQAEQAAGYNQRAGLSHQVSIEVRDMFTVQASEGPFDLIWSMESAEHIRDKQALLQHFWNLLQPGGRLLMATWCHRDTPPPLSQVEHKLLDRVCELYHLPPWISIAEYEQLATTIGFEQIKTADWSDAVAPFWKAVIQSALKWDRMLGLLKAGWSTMKGAYAMQYMTKGYRRGLIRFGLLQAVKP
ncbi:MAG: methyltransferase domain-containing protein [Bacteroidota bacterium]